MCANAPTARIALARLVHIHPVCIPMPGCLPWRFLSKDPPGPFLRSSAAPSAVHCASPSPTHKMGHDGRGTSR
ncbi:MAG: hypothetical protein QOK23_1017 [Gammaproteobacteria bacterium]|nr:hypothetical protein [Gammaproteobacteria bacterium]